jgi:hypothetical protein
MSVETDILTSAAEIMHADRIGALEENDVTSLMIVEGKRLVKYRDGSEKMQMVIMLQGQGADQQQLMSDMGTMLDALCKNARSIRGTKYNVQSARVTLAPVPVAKNAFLWFYKSNIEIIYIKKE